MASPRLFAQLYLDEDVDVLVSDLVEAQGFDVTTARKEGMLNSSDNEQLSFAAEQHCVLVTHNRVDFQELAVQYYEENRDHAGIICAYRRLPKEIAERLITLLNERAIDEFKNQILYI